MIRDTLLPEPLELEDGCLDFPMGSGQGLELDPEKIEKC